jgi:hypothetical protein
MIASAPQTTLRRQDKWRFIKPVQEPVMNAFGTAAFQRSVSPGSMGDFRQGRAYVAAWLSRG